jgi:hypothetical protein
LGNDAAINKDDLKSQGTLDVKAKVIDAAGNTSSEVSTNFMLKTTPIYNARIADGGAYYKVGGLGDWVSAFDITVSERSRITYSLKTLTNTTKLKVLINGVIYSTVSKTNDKEFYEFDGGLLPDIRLDNALITFQEFGMVNGTDILLTDSAWLDSIATETHGDKKSGSFGLNLNYGVKELVKPTVEIKKTATFENTLTNTTDVTYKFQFDEGVSGFFASDVAISRGTKGAFTQIDSLNYTLVVSTTTSQEAELVTLDIAAGAAKDMSLNESVAQRFTNPRPSALDIDSTFKLINPTVLNNKTFYYLDVNNDKKINSDDEISHTWLNENFNKNNIGYINPAGNATDDIFHFGTLKNIQLSLPTESEFVSILQGNPNSNFDFNDTNTYWTSTPQGENNPGYYRFFAANGGFGFDNTSHLVVLQII